MAPPELATLPTETLLMITSNLQRNDRLSLGSTCQRLNSVVRKSILSSVYLTPGKLQLHDTSLRRQGSIKLIINNMVAHTLTFRPCYDYGSHTCPPPNRCHLMLSELLQNPRSNIDTLEVGSPATHGTPSSFTIYPHSGHQLPILQVIQSALEARDRDGMKPKLKSVRLSNCMLSYNFDNWQNSEMTRESQPIVYFEEDTLETWTARNLWRFMPNTGDDREMDINFGISDLLDTCVWLVRVERLYFHQVRGWRDSPAWIWKPYNQPSFRFTTFLFKHLTTVCLHFETYWSTGSNMSFARHLQAVKHLKLKGHVFVSDCQLSSLYGLGKTLETLILDSCPLLWLLHTDKRDGFTDFTSGNDYKRLPVHGNDSIWLSNLRWSDFLRNLGHALPSLHTFLFGTGLDVTYGRHRSKVMVGPTPLTLSPSRYVRYDNVSGWQEGCGAVNSQLPVHWIAPILLQLLTTEGKDRVNKSPKTSCKDHGLSNPSRQLNREFHSKLIEFICDQELAQFRRESAEEQHFHTFALDTQHVRLCINDELALDGRNWADKRSSGKVAIWRCIRVLRTEDTVERLQSSTNHSIIPDEALLTSWMDEQSTSTHVFVLTPALKDLNKGMMAIGEADLLLGEEPCGLTPAEDDADQTAYATLQKLLRERRPQRYQ